MRVLSGRPDLRCMNTATLGFREPIERTARRVAAAGFGRITPWRQEIDEAHPERAAQAIRAAGLKLGGYCRTDYFAADDAAGARAAIASNRRAVEVAAVLGAPFVVAVVGGLAPNSKNLSACREQILEGLAALVPTLRATGVAIALEPLHPVYAANRSLLNTVEQARRWCERLDPANEGLFGIAVDAYHVWWDPELEAALGRAAGRVLALHVCDWMRETKDPLLDRGMMGDGVIELGRIRRLVEQGGFGGPVEVEIFSRDVWWKRDPDEVLRTCSARMDTLV
ncbi:sugar phosphate isomerase/epimerase [Verminephrobacter aporrectodeae subsp. tuberculatae]|uniref:Sugar phosphate isomerase/epimerase n=2 Tax=Verminephrobacter TaxID=364316 RepID=A0ABT3KU10_9BURK|nr:sugar phosphate isomerase/epimerase [Verminephrobacter aporrectodeae subsp. tuberculatae]